MIFKEVHVQDDDKNIPISIYGRIYYVYTFLEFHYVLHKYGSTKTFLAKQPYNMVDIMNSW